MAGLLTVHNTNPRYFDDGTGEAILLSGSHNWWTFQNYDDASPPGEYYTFTDWLNFLEARGHNFMRGWYWESPKWFNNQTPFFPGFLANDNYVSPLPYERTGPGNAADGGLKFDLETFDQDFFDRLRARAIAAGDRNIYYSIMLFQGFSLQDNSRPPIYDAWQNHPFNSDNNINSINGDPGADVEGYETHTLSLPTITSFQERYIKKVIDTVNDLDNVFYEIANETDSSAVSWQNYLVDYIHNYELGKEKQHLVWATVALGSTSALDGQVMGTDADIASLRVNYKDNMPVATGAKVIINDTDHLWGIGGDRIWAWQSFTRGLHPIFMDGHSLSESAASIASFRDNMGYIIDYANRMDLKSMVPSLTLSNTSYILANNTIAGEWISFRPTTGNHIVNTSGATGYLSVEWFNPSNGSISPAANIFAGSTVTLVPPFSNDSVVYMKNIATSPLPFRGIDIMGWSKDYLDNPYTQAQIDELIEGLVESFPTLTHIGIAIPMNTNAEATAERGSNFAIEPATYAARFCDKIHAMGLKVLFRGTNCFFEGLYSFDKTDNVNGTLANWESTPDSWLARAANWINDNIGLFESGDILAPYPEASSHWPLTNGGSYNQFFLDLKTVLDTVCTDNGLSCYNGFYSHLWTSAIQNSYNAQYTEFGMATYDHYGTALGPGKRFTSFTAGSVSDANTYTVPTSITENDNNRKHFFPEKVAYNTEIDVYVVAKGTGDWTMTIHDGSNNPVQMPDHTNFPSKSNSYQVTISNASLTNGAMNTFSIPWDNPAPDVQYHFHLTSTVADGTVKTGTSGSLNTVYCAGYKGNASPEAIEIDIRKTFARTGVPQFLQEWGDYWSTDSSRSDPVRDQTAHEAYLEEFYAAMQRLVDDGILKGFNYWRSGSSTGTHEGIANSVNPGQAYTFQLLYEGQKLKEFFDANGEPPVLPSQSGRIISLARSVQGVKIISGARIASGARTSV